MENKDISEHRKYLIQRLADGEARALPLIYQLESFYKREAIYQWFIDNGITGKAFVDFNMARRCSMVRVGKDVLGFIEHDRQKTLRVGRDLS